LPSTPDEKAKKLKTSRPVRGQVRAEEIKGNEPVESAPLGEKFKWGTNPEGKKEVGMVVRGST